jgi:hypothetical protein
MRYEKQPLWMWRAAWLVLNGTNRPTSTHNVVLKRHFRLGYLTWAIRQLIHFLPQNFNVECRVSRESSASQYGLSFQHDILDSSSNATLIQSDVFITPQTARISDLERGESLSSRWSFLLSGVRIKHASSPNCVRAAHFVLFNSLRSLHKTQSLIFSSSVIVFLWYLFGRKLTLCLFMAKCFTFRWGSLYRNPSQWGRGGLAVALFYAVLFKRRLFHWHTDYQWLPCRSQLSAFPTHNKCR